MYCVYEDNNPNFWYKMFNAIRIDGNKIILPYGEKTDKKWTKLAEKTVKSMKEFDNKKIVLSKNIKNQNVFVNKLQENLLDVVDGKWLFFMLLPEILEYVNKNQEIKEESSVHLLVNDITENVIDFIKLLTKKYKTICVVTKHIEKLNKIENQILEENGTAIITMNNKRKSLSKAKIIINIDFPEEFINQYTIYENAIILDICGNTRIKKKRFSGEVIANYEIAVKNKTEYAIEEKLFSEKDLYEAEFYKKQPYMYVREKIKKDGIEIVALYSQKGSCVKFS